MALLTKGIFKCSGFLFGAALQWLIIGMAKLAFSYKSAPEPGWGNQAGVGIHCWPRGKRVSPHPGKARHVFVFTRNPAKRKPSAL